MYASSSSSSPPQTIDVNTDAIAVLHASSTYANQSAQLQDLLTKSKNLENRINAHLSPQISRATHNIGTRYLKSVQMHQKTVKNLSKELDPLQKEVEKALKNIGKIQDKLSQLKPKETTEIEKQTRKAKDISTQITQKLTRSQNHSTTITRGGIVGGIDLITTALDQTENWVKEQQW